MTSRNIWLYPWRFLSYFSFLPEGIPNLRIPKNLTLIYTNIHQYTTISGVHEKTVKQKLLHHISTKQFARCKQNQWDKLSSSFLARSAWSLSSCFLASYTCFTHRWDNISTTWTSVPVPFGQGGERQIATLRRPQLFEFGPLPLLPFSKEAAFQRLDQTSYL